MPSTARTVVIAAADLLPELSRAARADGEVLAFADEDALRAVEAIVAHRPNRIALDHIFAATPRGAALISRVKTDPMLTHAQIHVVSASGEFHAAEVPDAPGGAPVLDQIGTRRAPRYRIAGALDVLVDGHAAQLVDLSTSGAQVRRPLALKPGQRVRLALADPSATVRASGAVAWASFEILPGAGGSLYRAGIEFQGPDEAALDAFRTRNS